MKQLTAFLLLFCATVSLNTTLAGSYMIVDSETATNPSRITAPIDFPREDYDITVTYTVYLNSEADRTIGESDLSPICDRYGNGRAYYSGKFQKKSASGVYYDSANRQYFYKRIFKLNCTVYKKSTVWNKIYTITSERYSELADSAYTRYKNERRWYKRIKHLTQYIRHRSKARQHFDIAQRYL